MSDDKPTPELVRELLSRIKFPGFPRDIVALGMVASERIDGRDVSIELRLPSGRTDVPPVLEREITAVLAEHGLRASISVVRPGQPSGAAPSAPAAAAAEAIRIPGVRSVLAVSSAKGGVGKSTVSTNLACAFNSLGLRVGLLDADVYGPSLPIMMGTDARPLAAGGSRFHPVERYGIRCISMGFFLDETSPVIWRGPMVAGLMRQFINDCVWGDLDVLVIDLPPGTGDAQLTLAQQLQLDGALIVTTPQEVALRDVVRGVAMFRQVQVPIVGVVENMSVFVCSECGEEDAIFGRGGGDIVATAAGAPLLARIPLDVRIRDEGDRGRPLVLAAPDTEPAKIYLDVARTLATRLGVVAGAQPAATA